MNNECSRGGEKQGGRGDRHLLFVGLSCPQVWPWGSWVFIAVAEESSSGRGLPSSESDNKATRIRF